ncbi:MAG: helix-turn-helix transcriptional regulator [Bryobacterales bacterium]|nr:helix-turn-helix transcriptional regulator [Bryobacterales bacterium]
MKKLPRLWRALECIPGLLAVLEVWRQECGEDFHFAAPNLRPTDRVGTRYPCPNSFNGCPRRIIDYDDDEFAAICQDPHQRCERVPLTRREAIIHSLDLAGFLVPVLRGAAIRPQAIRPCAPGLWAVGLSEQPHLRNLPVYFLLAHSVGAFDTAAARLLLDVKDSFQLVLPTDQFRTVEFESRLRDRRAECLCLEDQVLVDQQGEFHWAGVLETRSAGDGGNAPVPRSVGSDEAVEAVREYLKATGLSLTQFGTQINMTPKSVSNFLKTGKMRRSSFEDMAESMGLTPHQLLRGELPTSIPRTRRR